MIAKVENSRVSAEIRSVNDLFFGALDAASFEALSNAAVALVGCSPATQMLPLQRTRLPLAVVAGIPAMEQIRPRLLLLRQVGVMVVSLV